jgi:hypothetical protein
MKRDLLVTGAFVIGLVMTWSFAHADEPFPPGAFDLTVSQPVSVHDHPDFAAGWTVTGTVTVKNNTGDPTNISASCKYYIGDTLNAQKSIAVGVVPAHGVSVANMYEQSPAEVTSVQCQVRPGGNFLTMFPRP